MRVVRFESEDFAKYSENLHLQAFGEYNGIEVIDYALVVFRDDDPIIWCSIREENMNVAYMQFGGAFEKASNFNLPAYIAMINSLKDRYAGLTTRIENTNLPMLKGSLRVGFLIKGMRLWGDKLLLELHLGNGI